MSAVYATQLTASTQLRACSRSEALAALRVEHALVRRGRGYRVYRSDVHHEIYVAAQESETRSLLAHVDALLERADDEERIR